MKKLLKLFTRQPQGSKYMPQDEIIVNKARQKYQIINTLLQRSGSPVSVLDIVRKSNALNHTARITELRHALYEIAGKPSDVDFKRDMIRNEKQIMIDNLGEKHAISTYILMPEFHDFAVQLEAKLNKEATNA
jgi:hypothetical protein